MYNETAVDNSFTELVENSNNLYLDVEIPILKQPPSPLVFYRDYVSMNRPCIIENAFNHWPATYLWTNAYLLKNMGDNEVTVAVTPNGRADAIYNHSYFVLPEERKMPFYEFINHLELYHEHMNDQTSECSWIKNKPLNNYSKIEIIRDSSIQTLESNTNEMENVMNFSDNNFSDMNENDKKIDSIDIGTGPDIYCELCNEIFYCQLQNGCMTSEYSQLCNDIELEIDFVSKALNKKPDAVNLWMGESRSMSSLHQDPYENMFCVIVGQKHFILYPPTSEIYLKKIEFEKGRYHMQAKQWFINLESEKVKWIDYDFNESKSDLHLKCPAMKVTVNPGQLLYIPRLYFHEVRQTCDEFGRVIAINFWYDMNYDLTWNLLQFMKSKIYK